MMNRFMWVPMMLIAAGNADAAAFQLTLEPGADLGAPAGGAMLWRLSIANDDPSLFLSLDAANWTANLDLAQGTQDDFAPFLFPLLAPLSSEIHDLFSITWAPDATVGYAADNAFLISSSFCLDANYTGCIVNADVRLEFSASVLRPSDDAAATPEPAGLGFAGLALLAMLSRRLHRR